MDDKSHLKNILEARLNEKFDQYEAYKENFFEMIRERKNQYQELKKKDADSAKMIDDQMKKIKTITVRRPLYRC
jgi:hypothetical protein